ncbi:hypothetical protein, partial [Acinetobacter lwoffii]|uniref:hypothetical protein n=1 Tax=Acinetobacter lwoffii TaxID=28090 RepID=UPI0035232EF1
GDGQTFVPFASDAAFAVRVASATRWRTQCAVSAPASKSTTRTSGELHGFESICKGPAIGARPDAAGRGATRGRDFVAPWTA